MEKSRLSTKILVRPCGVLGTPGLSMTQAWVALYSMSAGSLRDMTGFLSQTNGLSSILLLISSYSSSVGITLHFKHLSLCAAYVSIDRATTCGFLGEVWGFRDRALSVPCLSQPLFSSPQHTTFKYLTSCRWVYRIIRNSYGFIHRFKARLVAKGFQKC